MVWGEYVIGVLFAILSAFMYSFASILYKFALRNVNEELVTAIRTFPALISILLLTIAMGEFDKLINVSGLVLFYGFIGGALGMMLGAYFYMRALKFGGVSIGFPSSFSYPVFVSLLATFFLREEIGVNLILGLISTLIGITILASASDRGDGTNNPFSGALNGLMAAILWSVSIVVSKIALENYPPISFAAIRLLFASLVATPIVFLNRRDFSTVRDSIFVISSGGILGIGLGIVFAHIALIYVGAIVSAIVSASSPALSLLLAWIFLGEKLNRIQLLGVIFVISGTVLTAI